MFSSKSTILYSVYIMRLLVILFAICSFVQATTFAALPSKPNIVIFLTDDQSQLDSTPYGAKDLRTPNMQALADGGMRFTQAFVASPSCAPSRGALLTGMMPARNGAEPNHSKPRAEIRKWPSYFQELGYEVVAFGKVSHYKHTVDYGFDYFAHDTFHDPEGIPSALEYLKKRGNSNKPLCIFVGSNWPHVPWPDGPEGYDANTLTLPGTSVDTPKTREWRARYAAAVTRADKELGDVMKATRTYLGEDSVFLFTSDHGAQWPFGKWNCYDAGIRVPLIVAWPGVIKPGSRTDANVSWIDFLPTLVEAAGGKAPKDIDGKSFLPVLTGKKKSHRDIIFATHSGDGVFNVYPMRAARTDDFKYIRNLHPEFAFTTHIDLPVHLGQRDFFVTWEKAGATNAAAAATVDRYYKRPAEELYDVKADPDEKNNLANDPKYSRQLKKLRGELDDWMKEQGDKQLVFDEPHLLSDPTTWGPKAVMPKRPKK